MIKNILIPLIAIIAISSCKTNNADSKRLPIFGERDTVTKMVNGQQQIDTVYHTIPPFSFVNQYGDSVTNKSLDGKIYVADFFFTTCPSICPVMHRNMLNVYNKFKDAGDVGIISMTIDPKYDSVAVLKKYADALKITGNMWWLVQGEKQATYNLAKSYLVTTPREDAKEKFIHDGYFMLIDKEKRIRGSYIGTDEKEVAKLIADIQTLRAEPEQSK